MKLWEQDLQTPLDLSDWQDIANSLSKTSINTILIKSNYKTLLHWYLVPTRIAKMDLTATLNCFR